MNTRKFPVSETQHTSYPTTPEMAERLENESVYHPPIGDQADRYTFLRTRVYLLKADIIRMTPPSREQSIALTHLDEAQWAMNAAIARNEYLEGEEKENAGVEE